MRSSKEGKLIEKERAGEPCRRGHLIFFRGLQEGWGVDSPGCGPKKAGLVVGRASGHEKGEKSDLLACLKVLREGGGHTLIVVFGRRRV